MSEGNSKSSSNEWTPRRQGSQMAPRGAIVVRSKHCREQSRTAATPSSTGCGGPKLPLRAIRDQENPFTPPPPPPLPPSPANVHCSEEFGVERYVATLRKAKCPKVHGMRNCPPSRLFRRRRQCYVILKGAPVPRCTLY